LPCSWCGPPRVAAEARTSSALEVKPRLAPRQDEASASHVDHHARRPGEGVHRERGAVRGDADERLCDTFEDTGPADLHHRSAGFGEHGIRAVVLLDTAVERIGRAVDEHLQHGVAGDGDLVAAALLERLVDVADPPSWRALAAEFVDHAVEALVTSGADVDDGELRALSGRGDLLARVARD